MSDPTHTRGGRVCRIEVARAEYLDVRPTAAQLTCALNSFESGCVSWIFAMRFSGVIGGFDVGRETSRKDPSYHQTRA